MPATVLLACAPVPGAWDVAAAADEVDTADTGGEYFVAGAGAVAALAVAAEDLGA